MRHGASITLIICGTLAALSPYVFNYLAVAQVAKVMVSLNKTVDLSGNMAEGYSVFIGLLGAAMIISGTIGGMCGLKRTSPDSILPAGR